ncbi:MAG TPA: imidazolonepropionase [Candidatus Limnocylindrales bacterium]|nr:imidazolonepropionase [Candidatus Limnocylindrales bacterium]
MINADLIIHDARQVVTCASPSGPKRGAALREVGLIADGAVVIADGRIVAVGSTAEMLGEYSAKRHIDASGKVVCPGFADAHTHAVYAGDRLDEFEQRIGGATYLDILAAGGGILHTVRATREAAGKELVAQAAARLKAMMRLGTTTVEIKTGYGLDTATELKMLSVIAALAETQAADLVPTFLGAHAVPAEYRGRPDDYIALVVNEMLPAAAEWYAGSLFAVQGRQFCVDVFCEAGAFDVVQSRLVLEAGRALGMSVRVHADEFQSLGGVALAVELGALSVDHLDVTTAAEMHVLAQSDTVGVIMPAVNFHLGSAHYADARALIEAGAVVALATDLNPGSAPCLSMPLVMAIACRMQKLLPAEALNASTINAAWALGMGEIIGSLEVGKQADMLIVNAPDYRQLMGTLGGNLVETVIKRGNVV